MKKSRFKTTAIVGLLIFFGMINSVSALGILSNQSGSPDNGYLGITCSGATSSLTQSFDIWDSGYESADMVNFSYYVKNFTGFTLCASLYDTELYWDSFFNISVPVGDNLTSDCIDGLALSPTGGWVNFSLNYTLLNSTRYSVVVSTNCSSPDGALYRTADIGSIDGLKSKDGDISAGWYRIDEMRSFLYIVFGDGIILSSETEGGGSSGLSIPDLYGGGIPPITEVIDVIKAGGDVEDVFIAYNPVVYPQLILSFNNLFFFDTFKSLPSKTGIFLLVFINYILRQPASLVNVEGI